MLATPWGRRITGVLLVAAVLVSLVSCGSSSADPTPGSIYLEARIVSASQVGEDVRRETAHVRWWSVAPERWRMELVRADSDQLLVVSDGEATSSYVAGSSFYLRGELVAADRRFDGITRPIGFHFGPVGADSVEALVDDLGASWPEVESFTVAGTDEVLSIETTVIKYSPLSRGISTTFASGTTERLTAGVGRLWVDVSRMVVLRHEIDPEAERASSFFILTPDLDLFGPKVDVEVTLVEYDGALDERLFEFRQPDRAIKIEAPADHHFLWARFVQ